MGAIAGGVLIGMFVLLVAYLGLRWFAKYAADHWEGG